MRGAQFALKGGGPPPPHLPADMAASLAPLLAEAGVPAEEARLLLGPGLTNLGERGRERRSTSLDADEWSSGKMGTSVASALPPIKPPSLPPCAEYAHTGTRCGACRYRVSSLP